MARRRRVEQFELRVGDERLVVTSLPVEDPGLVDDCLAVLTTAERHVALDAAAGLSNAAIAKKRKRALRTVANQLAAVYRKLDVVSRAELAALIARPVAS